MLWPYRLLGRLYQQTWESESDSLDPTEATLASEVSENARVFFAQQRLIFLDSQPHNRLADARILLAGSPFQYEDRKTPSNAYRALRESSIEEDIDLESISFYRDPQSINLVSQELLRVTPGRFTHLVVFDDFFKYGDWDSKSLSQFLHRIRDNFSKIIVIAGDAHGDEAYGKLALWAYSDYVDTIWDMTTWGKIYLDSKLKTKVRSAPFVVERRNFSPQIKNLDVTFVGCLTPDRLLILKSAATACSQLGLSYRFFLFPNFKASLMAMSERKYFKTLAISRAIINVSTHPFERGFIPILNGHFVEALACRTLVLQYLPADTGEIFTGSLFFRRNRDYLEFSSKEELRVLLWNLANQRAELDDIALSGYEAYRDAWAGMNFWCRLIS